MSKVRVCINESIGLERIQAFLINCILDNEMQHIPAKKINNIKIMSWSEIEKFIVEEKISMRLLSDYCTDWTLRYAYHIDEI